jgi:hypothetical protein
MNAAVSTACTCAQQSLLVCPPFIVTFFQEEKLGSCYYIHVCTASSGLLFLLVTIYHFDCVTHKLLSPCAVGAGTLMYRWEDGWQVK